MGSFEILNDWLVHVLNLADFLRTRGFFYPPNLKDLPLVFTLIFLREHYNVYFPTSKQVSVAIKVNLRIALLCVAFWINFLCFYMEKITNFFFKTRLF